MDFDIRISFSHTSQASGYLLIIKSAISMIIFVLKPHQDSYYNNVFIPCRKFLGTFLIIVSVSILQLLD